MVLTLNNTNTLTADNIIIGGTDLTQLYATKTELNDINNTSEVATNTADIAVLNTKQLQNFNNIDAINTNLTNNYQTNTQLSSNFYNKTEIDTTFTNYYTSTQIDTNLTTNYQNNTLLATNFYNKGEVDTLIAGVGDGGGGYTDTEIDNLLALRVPLSDFTDRFKTNPVIDCSAPTIIHSGLTLNNETINVAPTNGLLFSNQTGGGDKIVSVFKNATNYITLQGNKIISNATSDDSAVELNLNPSGNINIDNNLLVNQVNITTNLTLGGDIELTNPDTSIQRYNNATKTNTSMDLSINETASAIRLINGTNDDTDTSTYLECNNTTGGTTLFKPAYFKDTVNYESENVNISNSSGLTLYKDTTDASNVFTVKNAQGYIRFNSFNINAYNTSNDSSSLLLLNTANGNGCYCLSLGIGAIQGANKLNVSGGNSNFGGTATFQNTSTFNGDINVNNSGRIFQRADANSSLNVISTNEVNFSLQSNRADDPTTGSIALQLNDTNGITINRPVVNNQTFNSIGNIVGEADVVSWGRFMFQNSSELKEVLDTQYKLYIRNGDTAGEMNLTIGLESSTPEIQLTDGKVNLLGNLEITHIDDAGKQKITINNPDNDGWIRLSNSGLSRLDATTTGVDVYGVLTTTGNADINGTCTCVALVETSDATLKENIREVSNKKCYDVVKYIQPKTFNLIKDEDKKNNLGFIADDVKDAKLPPEWDNIIYYAEDHKLLAYNKMTVILWGAVKELMSEVEDLKKEVKKLKKDGKESDDDEKPKAKAKAKSKK